MIGRRPESLELAREWGLLTDLAGHLPDRSFDLVVDASGSSAGFAESARLVRPRGTLVLKSTYASEAGSEGNGEVDLGRIVVAEINLVGSRCGPLAPALRLLSDHAIDVGSLIDGRIPPGTTAWPRSSTPLGQPQDPAAALSVVAEACRLSPFRRVIP